ncbi:MAG: ABC transporter substrate-binding protein [Nostocoides sp.]
MFRRNVAVKRTVLFAAAAVAVTALTACGDSPAAQQASSGSAGSSGSPTSVTVTLNFLAGAPNSGFILAKEKGYYAEQGLDVKVQEGQGSNSTASLVAGGKSEFGYADGPSAITVASKGGALVNIGPILQTNGFSVMSLKKSGIASIKDLQGKSVALQPGTAQASLFDAVLAAADVPKSSVDIVNLDPSALVASLIQGKVDAITAGADNQAVQLRDQGADINEVLYRDAGVPTIGLSMIASSTYAEQNPEVVKKFVAASLKGWSYAVQHQDETADVVAKAFPQGADAKAIKEQFAVDAQLICPSADSKVGGTPESNWTATYDLMVKYLALPTDKPITDYYTNDYLPAELPAC